jgi:hypothetical protein
MSTPADGTGATVAGTTAGAEPDATRSGEPRNMRRRRDRGRNNTNRNPSSTTTPVTAAAVKFTGRCDELKGATYDCSGHSQVDGHTKTTREIAEHMGRTYSADAMTAVENLVLPTFDHPNDPADGASETMKLRWNKKVASVVIKEDRFEEDLKKVCTLIWGQCAEYLRTKLEGKDSHAIMKRDYDTIELLKSIKDAAFKFSNEKYAPQSLHEGYKKFYTGQQDKNCSIQDHYERFKNQVQVVEHCGGSIEVHEVVVDKRLRATSLTRATATEAQIDRVESLVKDEYLACAFLLGSDKKRFGKLIEDLENDYMQKNDKFPKTLVDAYNLLAHWKQDPKNLMRMLGATDEGLGLAFANVGDGARVPAEDQSHMQCYNCQEWGHYARGCTNERVERYTQASGTQALLDGVEIDD